MTRRQSRRFNEEWDFGGTPTNLEYCHDAEGETRSPTDFPAALLKLTRIRQKTRVTVIKKKAVDIDRTVVHWGGLRGATSLTCFRRSR